MASPASRRTLARLNRAGPFRHTDRGPYRISRKVGRQSKGRMRIVAIVALVGAGIAAAWAQNAPIDSQSGARTMLALHSPAAAGFGRIERYLLNESALRGRLAALLTLITAREMTLAHEWSIR